MNSIFRVITIGILALAVRTSFSQTVTAKGGVDYGSGNVVVETSGTGTPTLSCTGLKTYTQTDATAGKNVWRCVGGTMTQQGLSASGGSGTNPTSVGIPYWSGSAWAAPTPSQINSAAVDPTLNTAITFVTGSTGDSTVPAPGAGKDILAEKDGVIKLSHNGGAYAALSSSSAVPVSCQPGLGDGLNAIPSGTYLQTSCYNDSGATWTLTGLRCYADAGTPTMAVTNGAGTALLTGAVTCSTAYASGTQSGTVTIAAGDFLKFTFVDAGTAKQITAVVTGSHP